MQAVAEGAQEALGELVVRYQNDLLRFCMHSVRDVELAKELTQETFIRVYAARHRFDAQRSFKPWVLCIARNLCLNAIKRKRAIPMDSLEAYASSARADGAPLAERASDGPDEMLHAKERAQLVSEALDDLDAQAREIVVLRFFEKLPARDIAAVVDSTEGAVRTRLHRILKGMRAKMENIRDDI
jgi:RNA polymerase sigma-70 factor (ECF subfamily)